MNHLTEHERRLVLITAIVCINTTPDTKGFSSALQSALDYYNQDKKKGFTGEPFTIDELEEAYSNNK